ncbi:hypothetical protein ACFL3X_01390, partial [Gemmatimonadota bacterium]
PADQNSQTIGNNTSPVEQDLAQLEGVNKECIKKNKGIIESGQLGSVDWLADQADVCVQLEIRRKSTFDREFADYSETERQKAWDIALQRRDLERTTEHE